MRLGTRGLAKAFVVFGAVALVAVFLPAMADRVFADSSNSVYVGDTLLDGGNTTVDSSADDHIKGGSATFDAEKSELTLEDFRYEGPGYTGKSEQGVIDYSGASDLKIVLKGENAIFVTKEEGFSPFMSYGIYYHADAYGTSKSLIIDGEGSLDISFQPVRDSISKRNGIFCEPGRFTQRGGTVYASGGFANESAGLFARDEVFFQKGSFTGIGKATSNYECRGVYSHSSVTVGGHAMVRGLADNLEGIGDMNQSGAAFGFDVSQGLNLSDGGSATGFGLARAGLRGVGCYSNDEATLYGGSLVLNGSSRSVREGLSYDLPDHLSGYYTLAYGDSADSTSVTPSATAEDINASRGSAYISLYGANNPHVHGFVYSSDGDSLTATCYNDGCDLPNHEVSFRIVAPLKKTVLDKLDPEASLEGARAFKEAAGWQIRLCDIEYYTSEGERLSAAPVEVGDYYAKLTVAGVSAVTEYSITEPRFSFYHNLVLSGKIGLNFLMELPEVEGVDYGTSYMTFTVNGEEAEMATFDSSKSVRVAGTVLYKFTCYLNAIQMADTVEATFHYFDAEGTERTVGPDKSSAEAYVKAAAESEEFSEETKELVKALADYGYHAFLYLKELRGFGDAHTAMETVFRKTYELSEMKGVYAQTSANGIVVSRSNKIDKVTFSLSLDSETSINLYFTPTSAYKGGASATVNGKKATVTRTSDGRFKVVIPDLAAHKLGITANVRLTTGGAVTTVKVSGFSYIRNVIRDSKNTLEKNTVMALYNYYEKAKAYLESQKEDSRK